MRLFWRKHVDVYRPLSRRLSQPPRVEALEDRCLLSASLVRDINSGPAGSNPAQLTDHAGTLLFTASGSPVAAPLWRSDGTEGGTVQVSNLQSSSLKFVNGFTYFAVNYSQPGPPLNCVDLYRTDGTANGTRHVFSAPCIDRRFVPQLRSLTAVGDALYFAFLVPPLLGNPNYLYRITGDGPADRLFSGVVSGLTNVGGTLFFAANQADGVELWKSDGTPGGTVLVKDINPGAGSSSPQSLVDVNGYLYFTADDGVHGRELWISDGTAEGTVLLKDINPGLADGFGASIGFLTNINNVLVFSADDGQNGVEPWVSYGTEEWTVMMADLTPGPEGSWPAQFMELNGYAYFAALTVEYGYELWVSDGSPQGTALVRDINPGPASSFPDKAVAVNGLLYLSAEDPANGRELWVSDGTRDGTALVADINPGATGSDPLWLTAVGGTLFFAANDGTRGTELWKVGAGSGPSGEVGDASLVLARTQSPVATESERRAAELFWSRAEAGERRPLAVRRDVAAEHLEERPATPRPRVTDGLLPVEDALTLWTTRLE